VTPVVADHQFRTGIATAIRALRAERRWTQRELCRKIELSPAYLSELESGQKDASADVLERISTAFDFTMDEFLWVALLAMTSGEVPNVERRNAAFSVMKHVLGADPASREEIEQFIQFQQWKRANRGAQAPSKRPEKSPRPGQDEYVEPDFTED
jgi:transcriptional regulator with XRE-family HTH domain